MNVAPRVVIFGLGGTIVMTPTGTGGLTPALSARQLITAVPGLAEVGIDVEVIDFRQAPSPSLTFDDIAALTVAINEQLAQGIEGVVVTQGTDTMEETAYTLDLNYAGAAPVVVTGARRSPAQAGADGPANLLSAIVVAASKQAREQGVLVVMEDDIHAARYVQKTHTLATFQSPNFGPLGYVVEGQPQLFGTAGPRMIVTQTVTMRNPRVCLLTMSLGDDGHLLRAIDDSVDGLVIAGFGGGNIPKDLVPLLSDLAETMPVVLSSRISTGPVLKNTYGYPGSGQDLLGRGLISSGFLHPLKARILLRALLRVDSDRDAIAAAFGVAGGYADSSTWPIQSTISSIC